MVSRFGCETLATGSKDGVARSEHEWLGWGLAVKVTMAHKETVVGRHIYMGGFRGLRWEWDGPARQLEYTGAQDWSSDRDSDSDGNRDEDEDEEDERFSGIL